MASVGRLLGRGGAANAPFRPLQGGSLNGLATVSRAGATATTSDANGQWSVAPADTPRFRGGRLVVEEARTNQLRNPRAEGGSTGTQTGAAPTSALTALLPTHWAWVNHSSGLNVDVSPVTVSGMTGVRIRLYGTSSAGTTNETLEFEGRAVVAASAGQVWTGSYHYRLAAGTWPAGLNLFARLLTFNTGTVVDNAPAAVAAPDATIRRAMATQTCGTGVTNAVMGAHLTLAAGTVVDATVDILWPQLGLGAFPATLALPPAGAPAAAARNADLVSLPVAGWLKRREAVNLFPRSREFDDAAWTKTACAVVANAAVAPDGTTTADKIVPDATAQNHNVSEPIAVTAGTTYVVSVFAQAAGHNFLRLGVNTPFFGGGNSAAYFDLSNGTVPVFTLGTGATASPAIEAAGGGWYRCSLTVLCTASGTQTWTIAAGPTATFAPAGNGTDGLHIWEAMLTTGQQAPYLTTGATAASRFDTLPGTVVVRAVLPHAVTNNLAGLALIDDGTSANRIALRNFNGRLTGVFVANSATTATADAGATPVNGAAVNCAIAWDGSSVACCLNGGAVATAAGTPPNGLTAFRIGQNGVGAGFWNGDIESVSYHKSRLPDAQLQALTAP